MGFYDFKNATWDDFNRTAKGKRIWLFGAPGAKAFLRDIRKLGSSWDVEGVIDNDSAKWGEDFIDGWRVSSPAVLKQMDQSKIAVLICSRYTYEMAAQMFSMGVENCFATMWLDDRMRVWYEGASDMQKIDELKKILADQKSIDVVNAIVEKRENAEIDYSDICEFKASEYFLDEFWRPQENEVFIDGGVYRRYH